LEGVDEFEMDGLEDMEDFEIDEDALDEAAEQADGVGNEVLENAVNASEMVGDTDFADTLEEGMDGGEGAMGEHETTRGARGAMAGGATGAAIGGGVGAHMDGQSKKKKAAAAAAAAAAAEEEEEGEKKGGWFGNMGSAVFSAAKEQMAATLLGDDLAEMLVEKMEGKSESEESDDDKSDDSDIEKDPEEAEEGEKSKRSLFKKNRS